MLMSCRHGLTLYVAAVLSEGSDARVSLHWGDFSTLDWDRVLAEGAALPSPLLPVSPP